MPVDINKLPFTEKYLLKIGINTISQMQQILDKNNRNATKRLRNNMKIYLDDKPSGMDKGFAVILDYPKHGGVVLDGKMNYRSRYPSKAAIQSIMNWITTRGLSVGQGKLRTIYKNQAFVGAKRESKKVSKKTGKPSNDISSFAYAIWYANRNRGRVKTPPTNFLKPYQNLLRNSTFKIGLVQSLWKDGYGIFGEQIKRGKINEIKIKM